VQEIVATVRKLAEAKAVPVVLDSVQTPASQKEYIDLLEPCHGQIVYNGFTLGVQWADMGVLQQRELTTHFVSGWTRDRMEATLGLLKTGKMRIRPLITHLVPYTRAPDMYRMIIAKNAPFLGITLDWKCAGYRADKHTLVAPQELHSPPQSTTLPERRALTLETSEHISLY
jgi:threonine dehydrogenase-like Zn-dependent dehydrogenase